MPPACARCVGVRPMPMYHNCATQMSCQACSSSASPLPNPSPRTSAGQCHAHLRQTSDQARRRPRCTNSGRCQIREKVNFAIKTLQFARAMCLWCSGPLTCTSPACRMTRGKPSYEARRRPRCTTSGRCQIHETMNLVLKLCSSHKPCVCYVLVHSAVYPRHAE